MKAAVPTRNETYKLMSPSLSPSPPAAIAANKSPAPVPNASKVTPVRL
jgi:hypothetical protein